MKANEQEFNDRLKKLGDLYEEGKDQLQKMYPADHADIKPWERLFDILREMRDIAAVQLQKNHFINEN